MTKRERTKIINNIATEVAGLREPVAKFYIKNYKELKMCKMNYLPSPFEIADYYNIKYKFTKTTNGKPSFLSKGLGTIFISDEYTKDSYKSKILCAHELGHYHMHASTEEYDFSYENLIQEYEANVFAVLLMPQIMAGQPWETYTPRQLNQLVYEKVIKN